MISIIILFTPHPRPLPQGGEGIDLAKGGEG